MQKENVSWKCRIAYGGGDASCNIVMGMISTILTLFYTDYVGVHPAVIGLIMLVSRFLDGAATLAMGFIAEKTKSKYGKYRPWLLWTGIPYALSIVLLFTVPQSKELTKIIYIFITYNFCTTVMYNMMNVPYGSLAYVLTRDSGERDLLSIVRMTMASIARLVTVCGTLPLVKIWGDGQAAWIKATIIWAVVAVILQLFCFKECKEQVRARETTKETKIHFANAMKYVLMNKYFWAGACFQTMQYVLFAVTGTSLTYYCKYVFQDETWLYSVLYFVETTILIIAMLICPVIIRKLGKRKASLCGLTFAVMGHILFMLNPESLFCVAGSCVVRALGFAPLNSVVFAFLGEAIEYGQWKNNVRQESLIYATSTVTLKIGAGISSAMITALLSAAGYVSSATDSVMTQPQSAVDMIINIYKYGPLIVLLICFGVLFFYRLEKELPNIEKELEKREIKEK